MDYMLFFPDIVQKIGAVSPFCFFHPFQLPHGAHILLRHSIGAQSLDIHKLACVKIGIARNPHIRL